MLKPKLDERTGEHIENVFAGTRESYYIPFTRKDVDEIMQIVLIVTSLELDMWSSLDMKIQPKVLHNLCETSFHTICFCGRGINSMNGNTGQWTICPCDLMLKVCYESRIQTS